MAAKIGLVDRLRRFLGSFQARIYAFVVGPLVGLGILLTVLFLRSQERMLETHVRQEGATVANLLAHDIRVGVFSENQFLLSDVVEGAAGRPEVLAVAVFNEHLKPLQRRWGARRKSASHGWIDERDSSRALAAAPHTLVTEGSDHLTFWAPVYAQGSYASEEGLYYGDVPRQEVRPVGLVAVMISTGPLQEGRRTLLTRALFVLGGGLLLAAVITLLAAREAARPLARLLGKVRGLNVPAPTSLDDLGMLSDTFGHLVRSLRRAFTQIAELNDSLEQKVAERTLELGAANAALTESRDHLEERVRQRTLDLEKAHQLLLHAEKMSAVGRMSASLAHEINNPIFAVRNVLDSLKACNALDDHQRELVQAASEECMRVAKLIRDLQGFNRPTSDVRSIVQVEPILDAVVLLCRKALSVNGVTLETSYASNLPSLWAVADQMKQVFLNLFTNAMDAMSATGGTLRVRAEATPSEVVVRVEDTGPGIPEENLPFVFDPFFTTKPEAKGTGLGLSISREIVQNHGGSIDVESSPSKGTSFTVRLPIPTGDPP